MKKQIAKKTIILYILKMLEDYPESNKPITYTDMAKTLKAMGIQCDRKTVGRNIDYLIEFGCPIIKEINKGCYLNKSNYKPLLKNIEFK